MQASAVIRWGIIGAGDVCEVKSGPAFYKAENSQLHAVMRRNGEKAKDFAERHRVPHWYDDAEALLANEEIDAVYIATPPAQHKDYAIAALNAGKHVYIEKPVTLNASQCEELMAAESAASTKVVVAHYRRQVPSFLKVAQLLSNGAIGTPLMAQIEMLQPAASDIIAGNQDNWRLDPKVSGGGLFFDLAPHQLDLMLQWFGPVTSAHGISINQRQLSAAHDCTHGWAILQNSLALQGRWHFGVNSKHTRDHCEIIGSEGKLSINFFGQQVIRLENAGGIEDIVLPNPTHIQQPFIEQVNAYFRGERDNPCSLAEAYSVMELMDCFANSYEK